MMHNMTKWWSVSQLRSIQSKIENFSITYFSNAERDGKLIIFHNEEQRRQSARKINASPMSENLIFILKIYHVLTRMWHLLIFLFSWHCQIISCQWMLSSALLD